MASSKEQIMVAAAKSFKTKDFSLAGGATVQLRELLRHERDALDAKLFECGPDGKPVATDGQRKLKDGVDWAREWLAATMTPAFTAEELADGVVWPDSVLEAMFDEARKVNGFTVEGQAKNS